MLETPTRFDSDLGDVADLFREPARTKLETEFVQMAGQTIRRIQGEFWTAGQRQASSIHEVSYRACFKPQLPVYFIRRFTQPGQVVYDPFSGRGTTAIEAALSGRTVIANDINPLATILARPRINVPTVSEVEERLRSISYSHELVADLDLSMFFESKTESEILSLRTYLSHRRHDRTEDHVDEWIRMTATNRLTGHSPGFFSVYTFPPNQAVSAASQVRINERRKQKPTYRDTKALIAIKTRQLLRGLSNDQLVKLRTAAAAATFLTRDARATPDIPDSSVQLTVTSPPFLDVVQYAGDNWLRCWFNDLPIDEIGGRITMAKTAETWTDTMGEVFLELFRVTRAGGVVAFEVGEIRSGRILLEEYVVPIATQAGFTCEAVLINSQAFTKTANLWGVANNKTGTNSNRIVVLRKA